MRQPHIGQARSMVCGASQPEATGKLAAGAGEVGRGGAKALDQPRSTSRLLAASFTDFVGIHSVLGTFVAGLCLPRGEPIEQIRQRLEPVVGLHWPTHVA
ncbi:hypothetical protein [Kribbella antibiotica]|uniref:hypothetical protein n=1 Tax=Kribbella antibiotica TaxID=190195 RepID=UPI00192D258C|nr:hypothetical protein [Kribbella antibiotica]